MNPRKIRSTQPPGEGPMKPTVGNSGAARMPDRESSSHPNGHCGELFPASVTVDGLQREYLCFLPENLNRHHARFLFVLHGSTMSARQMAEMTGFGFNKEAQKRGDTIVVYPQGYQNYWNDCRKSASYAAKVRNLNEVRFFEAFVEQLTRRYRLSESTLYVAGYSNGAQLVYRLAREHPEMFQAYAAICASLPTKSNDGCNDAGKAVNILIANGTADPVNPFGGGEVFVDDDENRGEVLSTLRTLAYWKSLLGGEEVSETRERWKKRVPEEKTEVTIYGYHSASLSKKVLLVQIENGGHVIPNPDFSSWPEELGPVNGAIDLPKFIMDFFGLDDRETEKTDEGVVP